MMIQYQTLTHSKKAVIKATKALVENNLSFEQKINSLAMLANFRSSHEYPMQSMIGYFRDKAFLVDKKAVVVRRLKRIPSILNKLKRFPQMQVSSMADIGGIRIITKNINQVQAIRDRIVKGRTHNKLLSQKNYITYPKESGYRGIHLNYSYQGSKQAYKGFRVELQIRSEIQHAWATAVEVAGTFMQQNLKASLGNKPLLEFFKTASHAFACLENKQPIDATLKNTLKVQAQQQKIVDKLKSYSLVAKHSDKKEGFYLIQLDIAEKTVSFTHFSKPFIKDAFDGYRRIEQEIADDTKKDVVLVSAESLNVLAKAYPNYFADTKLFLSTLYRVLA